MKQLYAVALSMIVSLVSFSQAGSLLTSFGTGGKAIPSIGANTAVPNAMVVQPDGKVTVAGYVQGSTVDLALVRYNLDGTLDNSFDMDGAGGMAGGMVVYNFGGDEYAYDVVVQPDGKIVIAGSRYSGGDGDFLVARFNSDGTLDNSFDFDGRLTTSMYPSDVAYSITIQNDGKILIAGTASFFGTGYIALLRYTSTGFPDASFGSNGTKITSVGSGSSSASEVVVQPDGKIVVGGSVGNGSNNDYVIARYTAAGELDNSFDTDGIALVDIASSSDQGGSLAIQADGKYVIGGSSFVGTGFQFSGARLNTNGSLDNTFDGDGKVTTMIGSETSIASKVALQEDGKILLSGYYHTGSGYDFALVRYTGTGALDNSFDGDGITTVNFGTIDMAYAIALSGFRIYLAGETNVSGTTGFALAALQNDAVALPLSLLSFTAAKKEGAVHLNWTTASEQNTSHFEVERSADGRTFTSIGSVKANGNSTHEKKYTLTDQQPLSNLNYYRLKSIDMDGKFTYSKVVVVRMNGEAKLEVYPNPAQNTLQVQFTSVGEPLAIYDVTGRIVKTVAISPTGTVSTTLDISDLKSGIYILKVGTESVRLVKN